MAMNPSFIASVLAALVAFAFLSQLGFLKSNVSTIKEGEGQVQAKIVKDADNKPFDDELLNLEQEQKQKQQSVQDTTTPKDTTPPTPTTTLPPLPTTTTTTTTTPKSDAFIYPDDTSQPPIFKSLSDPHTVTTMVGVNVTGLKELASDFFAGRTCKRLWGKNDTTLEAFQSHDSVLRIAFGCQDLYHWGRLGTGNFITAFYGVRMAAHAMGHSDVDIQCYDAEETKARLILPWMMGLFPRLSLGDPDLDQQPTVEEACRDYKSVPIGYRWKDMLFELRRMAIAMIGIPSPDHPSAAWAEQNLWAEDNPTTAVAVTTQQQQQQQHMHGRDYMQLPHPKKGEAPLFPNTQVDDAVLHFRCGDIINSNHPSFGFMKFGSFSRHISPEARRIGVVTQPFDGKAQQRFGEGSAVAKATREKCRKVVYAFLDHLEERFPNAQVNLYNSKEETIALTFARLIMANQTVIAISSFGVFPGVATFGTGYIREPDYIKAPNRWLLTSPILQKVDHVKLIQEPRIMCGQVKHMWGEDGSELLQWFRNYDDTPGGGSGDPPRPRDENHKLLLTPIENGEPVESKTTESSPPSETKTPKTPDKVPTTNADSDEPPPVLAALSDPHNIVNTIAVNNTGLRNLAGGFFKGETCKQMWGNDTNVEEFQSHSSVIKIEFGCLDLFQHGAHGTGNFITAFYGVRMAAHAMGHSDVIIECFDAEETKSSLILPWMMGIFPRLPPGDPDLAEQPTVQDACRDYKTVPIGYRWKDMLFELRRMAIAMVGIPSPDHPSAAWAEKNLWANPAATHSHGRDYMQLPHPKKGETPLFPDTNLDDAVLHFRCGDIINSNHPSFGFMKFASFSRHISPDVRRIGVVTQPFEAGAQQRKAEGGEGKRKRCKMVVYAFMDHLKEKFPNAEISLHNSVDETIALTFARMIMANQTVIGITSFGVFPGVSTFGTGYIRKPDYMKAPNRWLLTSPILQKVDHVKLIEEPRLMAPTVKRKWGQNGTAVLEWFKNYDIP